MMKKFKGFYEDEESQKMISIINENAEKEFEKRKALYKKEKREDKFVKVFVVLSLLFMACCIIYMAHKMFGNNVAECIANGGDVATCEYKFTK